MGGTPNDHLYDAEIVVESDCECCQPECQQAGAWGDANGNGIGLSSADFTYLLQVIYGLQPVLSGCGSEMDGFKNKYYPCNPTLGDFIAYQNYMACGIGCIPGQNCVCMASPIDAGVSIVVP